MFRPTGMHRRIRCRPGFIKPCTSRDASKKAIVGLVMTVGEIEGSFKLNQHKSDVDHAGVASALARQADAAAQLLASEMRALRPQLFASGTAQLDAMATPEGTM